MSVTFYPEILTESVSPAVIVCACGTFRSEEFPSYDVARLAQPAVTPNCFNPFCRASLNGTFIEVVSTEPEVQLSNRYAEKLLDILGILTDEAFFADRCVGSLPADDFKGRVLVALAVLPEDEGAELKRTNTDEDRGAKTWDAPRPVGFYQDVLVQLLEVAEFALESGREVVWA